MGAGAPRAPSLLRQRREGGGIHFPFLCSLARCNPFSLPGPRQLFLEPFTRQLEERAFHVSLLFGLPPFSLSPHWRLHLGASPWLDLPFLMGRFLRCSVVLPGSPMQRPGSCAKISLSPMVVHSFCGTLAPSFEEKTAVGL